MNDRNQRLGRENLGDNRRRQDRIRNREVRNKLQTYFFVGSFFGST